MSARSHRTRRMRMSVSLWALAGLVSLLSLLASTSRSWSVAHLAGRVRLLTAGPTASASTDRPSSTVEHHFEPPSVASPRPAHGESLGSAPRLRGVLGRAPHAVGAAARPYAVADSIIGRRRCARGGAVPRTRERAERMVFLI